jgi:MSHA biogenesis protein MshO
VDKQQSNMANQQSGFNLIELVLVIVVMGIISVVIAPIVTKPFTAYDQASRRLELVDAAESTLRLIAREVRDAVPNTVRTNGTVLELMPIEVGGRYRYGSNPSDNTALTPEAPDSQFRVLGNVNNLPANARMVVYNTGANQFYVAANNPNLGIVTPASTSLTLTDNGNEDIISLSTAFRFDRIGSGSPAKRFYITNTPVTYHCDLASGTLRRIANYAISVSQPTNRAAAPLSTAAENGLVVNNVTACNFNYQAGSSSRAGLLSISLSLTIDGEVVTLLHQIHIGNAP